LNPDARAGGGAASGLEWSSERRVGSVLRDEVFTSLWTEELPGVPIDVPLLAAGVASARMPALARRLSEAFSVALPSMLLLEHPTIRQISSALDAALGVAGARRRDAAPATPVAAEGRDVALE